MRHKHEGWSSHSHFGAKGTVHGSQGLRGCSRDTAWLLTTWRCFLSPGLLLSVRSSHERETKALIVSAVIWGFSMAYSCMQFLTDMPVNNNVFMENWDACNSSAPKPSLAGWQNRAHTPLQNSQEKTQERGWTFMDYERRRSCPLQSTSLWWFAAASLGNGQPGNRFRASKSTDDWKCL